MATAHVWNVFVPVNLLGDSSVLLIGHVDERALSVYITDTQTLSVENESVPVIGEFTTSNVRTRSRRACSGQRSVWVNIRKSSTNVLASRLYRAGEDGPCKCVTVLCDPSDLESSFVFQRDDSTSVENTLSRLLLVYTPSTARRGQNGKNSVKNCRRFIEHIFAHLIRVLIFTFTIVESVLRLVTLKWFWSQICILAPSILNNVTFKLNRFKRIQGSLIDSKHRSKLILLDTCSQQFLDTALGVVLMLCVMSGSNADVIATFLMKWADDTAHYLNDLLHWLMGAPAGLKLNAQLTQYMGHFFLYHVYLWSGYLSILRPWLGWVIWTAASFGLLGMSTQLCLVQDIISMMTLHIYCFYVYAARLYCLQIYALSSLWRLFRGKKWNVLRLRVDSALYTIDQLCVGTLLFTVLLFLLPTSLLYYTVFTALRLLVLSFHGVLTVVKDVLNMVPAATVLLRLLKSKCVTGDVLFTVLHDTEFQESDSGITLSMQVIHLPLPKLYRLAQTLLKTDPHLQDQHKYSWTELLKKVISGDLVYPWVNPITSDRKEKES
ncbi:phosphatidylinositol N-acetylglucosaminyltransferase subunit Q-like [Babylonia areolata]|uniref:phosphatidylinositol N-acetylglucosaminyltransferase subunit Q-like n=1 Tax=Babylonia areolata TaxID=304850 RepID=UPI003FD27C79